MTDILIAIIIGFIFTTASVAVIGIIFTAIVSLPLWTKPVVDEDYPIANHSE